jgi:hypothetical protein
MSLQRHAPLVGGDFDCVRMGNYAAEFRPNSRNQYIIDNLLASERRIDLRDKPARTVAEIACSFSNRVGGGIDDMRRGYACDAVSHGQDRRNTSTQRRDLIR